MKHRSYWVDYAKAIGIILVVYGHIARGIYNAGINISPEFYEIAYGIVYSFHIPLFFFLSGLFFYSQLSKKGGLNLVKSKVDTIFYPYVIWSILQGVLEAFLSSYTNGTITYFEVFSLFWLPRAQFWFLYALFIVFTIASIIFTVVSKKAAIVVFLLSVILYISPWMIPDFFVFNFISQNFVFFVLGIIFSSYSMSDYLLRGYFFVFATCMFIIGQFLFHNIFGLSFLDKGIASLLLAIVSIFFVIILSSWASLKPNRLVVFIGSSSMPIYLMHIIAGSGIRVILKNNFAVDSAMIHLVVGCFFGIFAPLLALIIINKLKIPYIFSAPISRLMNFSSKKIDKI